MGLTETHIRESTIEHISGNKKKCTVYHNEIEGTNEYIIVGILIEEEIPAMNSRIFFAEIQLDKYNDILLAAYTPTLIIFEQNPAIRKDFCESLSEVTNRINKIRHMMITIGDFNVKTGTGKTEYRENIGKYGKGRLNTNGRCFLEHAKEHDMILINTMFNHKMCHRTIWTAPEGS